MWRTCKWRRLVRNKKRILYTLQVTIFIFKSHFNSWKISIKMIEKIEKPFDTLQVFVWKLQTSLTFRGNTNFIKVMEKKSIEILAFALTLFRNSEGKKRQVFIFSIKKKKKKKFLKKSIFTKLKIELLFKKQLSSFIMSSFTLLNNKLIASWLIIYYRKLMCFILSWLHKHLFSCQHLFKDQFVIWWSIDKVDR